MQNAELELKNENIICFAGEDWWYHNPHSNFHIMKSFAKENRVLFVNSIGVSAPNMNDKYVWKRIGNKIKSLARYLKKVEKNIYVLSPIALPLIKGHEKIVQRFNKFLILLQMKVILKIIRFEKPILWVCAPSFADVALALKKRAKCLIYYCVDNITFYSGEMNPYILDLEIKLHSNADAALFVNHRLVEERKKFNPKTYHIGHGVDYDHYAVCQNGHLSIPSDMEEIKAPIVGYIGVIRGVNLELVKFLADKNQDVSFVFIGDIQQDISSLKDIGNVHFLGRREYRLLPQYMQKMSCFGIFYQINDVFNNYRNPKKLLEYFASGKPIVSVPILELEYFKELVYIAENYEAFDHFIKKALYNDSPELRKMRIQFAKEHTWDVISSESSQYIFQAIKGT